MYINIYFKQQNEIDFNCNLYCDIDEIQSL